LNLGFVPFYGALESLNCFELILDRICQILDLFIQISFAHPLVGYKRAEAKSEEDQQVLQKVFHDALKLVRGQHSQLLNRMSKEQQRRGGCGDERGWGDAVHPKSFSLAY